MNDRPTPLDQPGTSSGYAQTGEHPATGNKSVPASQSPDFIVPVRVKWPALLAALSLFIPGLGQIFCAQDNKGVFLMGMALLGYWLTGGIATLLLCLLNSLDAFVVARAIQKGALLRKWDFFPGVKPLEKLPPRTFPLIIVLVILTLMTIRVVIFAHGYVAPD